MHRTTAGKGAMLLGLLCNLVCSAMVADAAPVASVAAAVGASQLTAGTEPVAQLPRARRGSEDFTQHAKKHCYNQRLAPHNRYSYPSLTAAKAACAANSNCFGVYDELVHARAVLPPLRRPEDHKQCQAHPVSIELRV